jgi:hypothetical protein
MWIHFTDEEARLIADAMRGLSSDKPGDPTVYDPIHDKIMQAIANFDPADPYRAAAQEDADDELEVDDDAAVSPGEDPGAWVQAWIWITDEEAGRFTCEECSGVFTLDRRHCSIEGICDECAQKDDEEDGSGALS